MSKSCKICWIILIVFIVGNLGLLSFWLMNTDKEDTLQRTQRPDVDRMKKQWRRQFMERLDLDTLQYQEFARMRNEHVGEVRQYHKQIDSLKKILMNQTFSGESDSIVVNNSIDEIGELQKRIELLNYCHYRDMRSKCRNEEQRLKLDRTFRKMIDRPRERRHGRGRGPR